MPFEKSRKLSGGRLSLIPVLCGCRESGNFVMWMHIDTEDYEWARVGVAVASNVTGPYHFLTSFRPHNQHSRDLTVFQVPLWRPLLSTLSPPPFPPPPTVPVPLCSDGYSTKLRSAAGLGEGC